MMAVLRLIHYGKYGSTTCIMKVSVLSNSTFGKAVTLLWLTSSCDATFGRVMYAVERSAEDARGVWAV